MARSRPWSSANADLRRRSHVPSPPIAAVEQQLWQWVSPASLKPAPAMRNTDGKRMRNRILSLPVMVMVAWCWVWCTDKLMDCLSCCGYCSWKGCCG